MDDSRSGGGPRRPPKPRIVNKKPPARQDKPASSVGSLVGSQIRHPPPAPRPSWTKPIGRVNVVPPAPPKRQPAPVRIGGRLPTYAQPAPKLVAQDHRRAMGKRAQQVLGATRRDVNFALGQGPRRTLTSVGFAPSPHIYIGKNPPPPPPVAKFQGKPITPQMVARSMARVQAPGHARSKMRDVQILHLAGISDPYGSTTHPEYVRQQHVYRNQLLKALERKRQALTKLDGGGISISPRELQWAARGKSIAQLEAALRWQPSQSDLAGAQVQTAGFSMQGLNQFAAGLGALTSGIVQSGIPGTAGKIAGNALGDVLEIPGEAVPSLYHALSPLASGKIGETASRFVDPFVQIAKHPLRSFVDHPLGTGLMVVGPLRGAGRAAGFVARHGTPAMREFGSLDRGVARLPDTQFQERMQYSPNLVTKRIQIRRDAAKTEKAKVLYQEARQAEREGAAIQRAGGDAQAKFQQAAHKRVEAQRLDPKVITDQSKATVFGKTVLQRALDEDEAFYEGIRRLDRARVVREATLALGKKPSNLTRPVVEGIVAASRKHVEHYLEQIKQEAKALDPVTDRGKLLANEQLQQQIRKALDDPKTNLDTVLRTAERYRAVVAPIQKELADRRLLNPEQGAHAALRSYAVRYMGAKFQPAHWVDHEGNIVTNSEARSIIANHPGDHQQHIVHIADRVIGPHGKSFTPAEIRAHMAEARKAGDQFISDPQYVSQQPYLRSASAYFKRWSPRVGIQTGMRTGKAVTEGTIDAHPSTLLDQAARAQSLLSADKAFQDHIDQFGYRTPDGKVFQAGTKKAVNEMKRQLEAHGSPVQWRAVRLNPLGAEPDALTALIDATNHTSHTATEGIHRALVNAFEGGDGAGPWGLVPDQIAARAADHQKLLGSQQGVKAVQKATSMFRKVVLVRPSFIEGNTFEAILRGGLKGALPGMPDYWMMRQVLDSLPATARDSVLERAIGGGQYKMASKAHIHRPVDQLGDGRVARVVQGVAHTRVAHAITDTWDKWNHAFFSTFNGTIERQFKIALAGKELRNDVFPHKLLVLSKKSIQEAADGLTDTPTQRMYGRAVDRAYGQYDKFTPEQRRWLMLYTPFGAWMLNSLRFALQVLPKDHPVVSSLLAAATQTSQEWRNAAGLTQGGGQNQQRVPGFLQGSIPGDGSSHLRGFTRFTPAGFWSDPLAALGSAVLPQFSGVQSAFKGTDWKGRPLTDQSTAGKVAEAFKELFGSIVPFAGQEQQIFTGKGTLDQRLRKFADPFMYTPSATTGRSSGSGLPPEIQKRLDAIAGKLPAGAGLPPDVQAKLDEAAKRLGG